MKIDVNGSKSDLSAMLLSAERYALGRQTYIVEWTCKFISNNLHLLLGMDKKIMIRDIKQQEQYGYGAGFDKEEWIKLLDLLEKEGKVE